MMKENSMRKNSFIVRIWWTEEQTEWRGLVQHVHSGEAALVQSLDELVAFIERRTGQLTNPGPAPVGDKGLK
jgi:hypothetical protein